MGGKKEPKKLTKAEQEKLDAKNREKAIEDVWKACKQDKATAVQKALTLGFPLDYCDPDVRSPKPIILQPQTPRDLLISYVYPVVRSYRPSPCGGF